MVDFAELFAFCDLHASRWNRWPERESWWHDTMPGWPRYFDRHGFPIPGDGTNDPTLVWARMMERANGQDRVVACDDLPDTSYLSTVWLGLDHGFGGPPLFFETMRFSMKTKQARSPLSGHVYLYRPELEFPDPFGEPGETTTQLRYGSEEEALAAHHEIVRRIRVREGH